MLKKLLYPFLLSLLASPQSTAPQTMPHMAALAVKSLHMRTDWRTLFVRDIGEGK